MYFYTRFAWKNVNYYYYCTIFSLLSCFIFLNLICDSKSDFEFSSNNNYNVNSRMGLDENEIDEPPRVRLQQGTFIGKRLKSRAGRFYYAFVGIRYAKPVQRFQPIADLPDASSVVQNATSYGPFCLQHDWFKNKVLGDEDCLYINIYTPKLPQLNEKDDQEESESSSKNPLGQKIPVMMYIHGGAFLFGSGNVYLPDYFMDENVVLITMNYRLGVLGLFAQGISHSGTALCPWAFVRNPKRVAIKFAQLLDCPQNSTAQMLSCLRSKDATTIVTNQEKLTVWNRDPFALFGPSVESFENMENELDSVILPDTPYKLFCNGKSSRVPWILGVCKDEGLLFHSATILHNKVLMNEMETNWTLVAPVTLIFDETARNSLYVAKKVRKYYFGSEIINEESLRNLTDLYSDRYFFYCTQASALLYARNTATYLYQFSYPGEHSILQAFGLPKYGIAHGDDLQYFFPYSKFPFLPLDTEKGQFSQKVIRLWVSFAETGIPKITHNGDDNWPLISKEEVKGEQPIRWYSLDFNSTLLEDPYHDRMTFWKNLPLHELKSERKIHKVYDIADESQLRGKLGKNII